MSKEIDFDIHYIHGMTDKVMTVPIYRAELFCGEELTVLFVYSHGSPIDVQRNASRIRKELTDRDISYEGMKKLIESKNQSLMLLQEEDEFFKSIGKLVLQNIPIEVRR